MDGHDTPPDASRRGMAEDVRRGLLAGLAILALVIPPVQQVLVQVAAPVSAGRLPDFGHTPASVATRQVVDWVAGTGYYVKIAATAVKDTAGNAYAGITAATTLNFTVDPSAFTVMNVELSPINPSSTGNPYFAGMTGAPAYVAVPSTTFCTNSCI